MRATWLAWISIIGILLQGCVSESTLVENRRLAERAPDQKQMARTRLALGVSYLERGDTAQARFNLEKARDIDDSLPEVHNALAYYYQVVGEDAEAEQAYRHSLQRDSNNPDTYNNFGAFLCQRGKYQQAEELLLGAVKKPGYLRVADSYENLALCARSQQHFVKYEQYLQQALRHNGAKVSLLYGLATLYYAMGDVDKAAEYQARLQQGGQVSPPVTLLRYLIASRRDDVVEKQAAEQFMMSVYPTSPEAGFILSGDFSSTEPEVLREQYKSTLTAPSTATGQLKPQIKIVKRKTGLQPDSIASALTVDDQPGMLQATPTQVNLANANPTQASQGANQSKPVASAAMLPARHQVQLGETLYQIASHYRLSVTELQQLNQLKSPTDIREGQWLQLQMATKVPAQYQVQDGDTLFSIAFKFNVPAEALAELNQLTPETVLKPGQQLSLPGGGVNK